MRLAALLGAALVALAAPAAAAAHANLLRTTPPNGAALAVAPRQVRVVFDDVVRVASGNAAVSNATGRSVLGGPASARGRVLVLPLAKLADGAYSVRWAIVSDDGHRERGVLAFAVGAAGAAPHSVLGASVPLTWSDIVLRTLYYLGVLAAGGAAIFGLVQRRLLGARLARPLSRLLFLALLAAFLGGSGIVHTAAPGTRYELVVEIAVGVALAGGAAAALAPAVPRLLPVAGAAALALLVAPTLAGHSLDPNQPTGLSVLADLVHTVAAGAWLGGLLSLVLVLPHAAAAEEERRQAARRFSTSALVAAVLLAAAGVGRAVTELSAVSQLWSTSYGRVLLVKTGLFVALVGFGYVNRTRLLDSFARLRRSVALEALVLASVVVAVAILTELRPGRDVGAVAAVPPAVPTAAVLPGRDAVVDAHELGTLAVAIARTPGTATVTVLASDGTGASGRRVEIDGRPAAGCGSGCYRAPARGGPVEVSVDGRATRFTVPERASDGRALLERVTRAYRTARTIVFDETLASTPTNAQVTRFVLVTPDRLSYTIRGGAAARVIGSRRWDRARPGARWVASPQTRLDVTAPYWRAPTNVHLVAPGVLTFLDRSVPAWFRVRVHGNLPSRMWMTAAAHFMQDRYVGFDVSVEVSPPASR